MAEREINKNLEGRTFFIPVEVLANDNPQITVPNPTSYDDMVNSFAPGLFDSIKVAQVDRVNKEGQVVTRWGIIDGHSKTKFALDHGQEHGIFQLECYNATQELLKNPRIADSPGSKKDSLTMNEYLRAVIPPTKEHREIAAKRIAAHIAQGWNALVGPEISQEFTATTAISILNDSRILTSTDYLLSQTLSRLENIITDETDEKRQIVERALIEMNNILQESGLRPSAVHKEIFLMIASQDPVIGGEKQLLQQIHGLLNLPQVQKKFEDSIPGDIAKQKFTQEYIANSILAKMSQMQEQETGDPLIIPPIILDSSLTLEESFDAISAHSPEERYNEIKKGKRKNSIITIYSELNQGKGPFDTELEFITRFSGINLRDEQLKDVAMAVNLASHAINSVNTLLSDIKFGQEALFESGVKQPTLDKIREQLADNFQNLLLSQTHHQLRLNSKELLSVYQQSVNLIKRDQLTAKTLELVEDNLAQRLSDSFGPEVVEVFKKRAVVYLIEHNEKEINSLIKQMKSLDMDLLVKVIDGSVTMQHAHNIQRERGIEIPMKQNKVEAEIPAEIVEKQNQEFSTLVSSLVEALKYIELNPTLLTNENLELGWDAVVSLVKIVNGHPDARRLIEEYPLLLRKINDLNAKLTLKND